MQIVLFTPDICTLLLRYRQRDDRLYGANVLLLDFSQPVIEALGRDSDLRTLLRDGQSACLLCFELFRPFPQAYILFHCCDRCCGFRLHTDSSLVSLNCSNLVHWIDLDCLIWSKIVQRLSWTLLYHF